MLELVLPPFPDALRPSVLPCGGVEVQQRQGVTALCSVLWLSSPGSHTGQAAGKFFLPLPGFARVTPQN